MIKEFVSVIRDCRSLNISTQVMMVFGTIFYSIIIYFLIVLPLKYKFIPILVPVVYAAVIYIVELRYIRT